MSKKENQITRRQSKNFEQLNVGQYLLIDYYFYQKTLNSVFRFKGVYLTKVCFLQKSNEFVIFHDLFFDSSRLSKYKKMRLKLNSEGINLVENNKDLFFFFNVYNSKFNMHTTKVLFCVLNKFINREIVYVLRNILKSFIKTLFSRRFNFFIDFLKITALFLTDKVSLSFYTSTLVRVFCILPKKLYGYFMKFIDVLFKAIVFNKNFKSTKIKTPIIGLKCTFSGKRTRKPRAKIHTRTYGDISIQNFSQKIFFSKISAYTRLGVFGFKIWICRKTREFNYYNKT
jgi:hypothetical protein